MARDTFWYVSPFSIILYPRLERFTEIADEGRIRRILR